MKTQAMFGAVLSLCLAAFAGEPKAPAPAPVRSVEFVSIPGGTFMMGSEDGYGDVRPIHAVTIKPFEMSKSVVTVEQYRECVLGGRCTEPSTGEGCSWNTRRPRHPVTCVTWDQAAQYAAVMGARLPSESEWEYAARSAGKPQKYPWGDKEPTCERAVMDDGRGHGCGAGWPSPVCSKPAGRTAQGLCDMAGNVWQWVQDKYWVSYENAPTDGGAFEGKDLSRVMRGGSFRVKDSAHLRAYYRTRAAPASRAGNLGFRIARSKSR